jgi:hypothetical protein
MESYAVIILFVGHNRFTVGFRELYGPCPGKVTEKPKYFLVSTNGGDKLAGKRFEKQLSALCRRCATAAFIRHIAFCLFISARCWFLNVGKETKKQGKADSPENG